MIHAHDVLDIIESRIEDARHDRSLARAEAGRVSSDARRVELQALHYEISCRIEAALDEQGDTEGAGA